MQSFTHNQTTHPAEYALIVKKVCPIIQLPPSFADNVQMKELHPWLPTYQKRLWRCIEPGRLHPGATTRLQRCHGLCYRLPGRLRHSASSQQRTQRSGRLQHARSASPFNCLWRETNGNHFTEECRNLQRSKEKCKAGTGKGKPTPHMPHLQSLLVKQAASSLLQTSQSVLEPGCRALCHMTLHKERLTHTASDQAN
jgi:hypothetical protein